MRLARTPFEVATHIRLSNKSNHPVTTRSKQKRGNAKKGPLKLHSNNTKNELKAKGHLVLRGADDTLTHTRRQKTL